MVAFSSEFTPPTDPAPEPRGRAQTYSVTLANGSKVAVVTDSEKQAIFLAKMATGMEVKECKIFNLNQENA